MTKYCKYSKTRQTLDVLEISVTFYVVEGIEVNNTLSLSITTNNCDYHHAKIWPVKNFTEEQLDDYVKTDFDTDVEMLNDIQQSYKRIFKLNTSDVFVFCDSAYSKPKLLINIDDQYLIYSPNSKKFEVLSSASAESKLQDENNYVKLYTNIEDAFQDPIFKNYIDILNEI